MFSEIKLRYIVHLLLTILVIGILFLPTHELLIIIWFISFILWTCFTLFMFKTLISHFFEFINEENENSRVFRTYRWVINRW